MFSVMCVCCLSKEFSAVTIKLRQISERLEGGHRHRIMTEMEPVVRTPSLAVRLRVCVL